MPVQMDHIHFPAPRPDAKLWRYSSLAKFLALYTSRKLYFPSLEALRAEDPFEGMPTEALYQLQAHLIASPEARRVAFPGIDDDTALQFAQMMTLGSDTSTDLCFVSCWHMNDHESAALWKIYSGLSDGLAVRTSTTKLAQAMDQSKNFIMGSVAYRDYSADLPRIDQALDSAFMKRKSFQHESEVRLLYWGTEYIDMSAPLPLQGGWRAKKMPHVPGGLSFACDVDLLIEEVVVSPYTPPWAAETIGSVLDRLGCKAPVKRSRLMDGPQGRR